MIFETIDWLVIGIFFVIVLSIGWVASKSAGKSTSEFFLGGRGMPWWLLGVSMVACTFSADTPNLVTGMVRSGGVVKNWAWWSFLITGMVTVFVYAGLWRRSEVMTDLEFYELRYGGKLASFLRGFRALYLGILFNCLIMGTVHLAIIKIGAVMFGLDPTLVILISSIAVIVYATLGGIKGVIWADFFQYFIAMFGAVYAAIVAVKQPEVGGLVSLLKHPNVIHKLSILPDFSDPWVYIPLLIIPIAVQWWSVWYPGSEPGGGGYIAQKMLSAKDEKNAIGATLFFNFAHYALRPWPWIIVGLASLVVFPQLSDIQETFPGIKDQYLGHDIAYPAMLTRLGPGWLGLVVASIIAAYMSTIGTHLNWGSSYIVNDFYKRFVDNTASEKHLVLVGRLSTGGLMIISAIFSLTFLEEATQAFDILLLSGAGTGLIYLLRWFWWRINAMTEVIGMITATVMSILLVLVIDKTTVASLVVTTQGLTDVLIDQAHGLPSFDKATLLGSKLSSADISVLSAFDSKDEFTALTNRIDTVILPIRLILCLLVVTASWLAATFLGKPEEIEILKSFYRRTLPGGPGWKKIRLAIEQEGGLDENYDTHSWQMPKKILLVFLGCVSIYCCLFSIGGFLYGNFIQGMVLITLACLSGFALFKVFGTLSSGRPVK
ncbi:Na+:solute symporter [Fulvivirga sp. M361]|uniref:sodium:solute symporter family protein n=1 Tax=Fulvivirga sp. M361 TaxID=2594266 RepID=UPI001179AB65|nr:sodium:solute symporter family protein [Fulvivirga sp. M361]TRX60752.1 Na+:solute symporter [Fulvivirga sp. M361]